MPLQAWDALLAGLSAIAGHARVLVYDLAPEDAPLRLRRTGITLRGSERWRAYLGRRRAFDDGYPALVIALRRLDRTERLLAVDWGTAHPNAYFLIEPLDEDVDLSSPEQPAARDLHQAAQRRDTDRVEELLRSLYGSWVYWPAAPATEDGSRQATLPLAQGGATLFERLQQALRDVFPPRSFVEELSHLLQDESELFRGRTVERARTPFLTRLGLPAVYDPSVVTAAVRRLVNEGRLSAFPAAGGGFFQGPALPVPDEVPNELFERMLL
jgi:hypothetical protein